MTSLDPFAALALPADALVHRRVPKTLLIENGAAPTAADKRRIREGIEELRWLAALKPTTIGVAEHRDAAREYLEIAVLKLVLRPEVRAERLIELVHRAVPYPVLLIAWRCRTSEFSLAHKRRSLADEGKTVIDGDIVSVRLDGDCADGSTGAFRDALALTRQPRATLHSLYQGWIDTVQALRAAVVTGAFSLPASAAAAADRAKALRECCRLDERIAKIRHAAGNEKQLSRLVDMNLELARLRADREAARERL